MTAAAGSGGTGAAAAVGGNGGGGGTGSGWTGIFGSIFGFDGGAAPNIHNYSQGEQDADETTKTRVNQDEEIPDDDLNTEDIQDEDLHGEDTSQDDINTQPSQALGDHLALSDEMQETQQEGKRPTSLWPPRKT